MEQHQRQQNSSLSSFLGTGWLAQGGAFLLVALIWAPVFLNPLLPLFSPHPLLQSAGVFTLTQAILVLQPTWTASEKLWGARIHAALNLLSFLIFAAGVALIEANKIVNHGVHFHSAHGYLGVVTAAVLLFQYVFGFLIWGVPGLWGGSDAAKSLWKYHRATGYLIYLLVLATVLSAIKTDYVVGVLKVKMWAVAVAVALIVLGVYPRIHKRKFGITRSWSGRQETSSST